MTADARTVEAEILERVRAGYESRGMRFIIEPTADVVPPFLGGHRPDAIALAPDGGVIIEVMARRRPRPDTRLSDIAARVAAHKGWEFRLLYVNEPTEEVVDLLPPTRQQIDDKIEEIRDLAGTGRYATALVIGWSVLESLAGLITADDARPRKPYSPMQTVQELAMAGHLDSDDAQRLREMIRLRNAAVHGDLAVVVGRHEIDFLVEQIRAVESALT
jgi:hypothetical protein